MTDADKPAFRQAFSRLGVATREKELDAMQLGVYFEALNDLDVEFLTMAADALILSSPWFPKVSEWRAMAAKIAAARRAKQKELTRRSLVPLCATCGDTGWIEGAADPRTLYRPQKNRETGELERVPLPKGPTPRQRCACEQIRRDEPLGRRPWPALPAATPAGADVMNKADAVSLTTTIERRTGRRIAPRVMPTTRATEQARADDRDERRS